MGWRVEVEGEVFEVEGVVGVLLFVGCDGAGEACVAYVAPGADDVGGDEDGVVCHVGWSSGGWRFDGEGSCEEYCYLGWLWKVSCSG